MKAVPAAENEPPKPPVRINGQGAFTIVYKGSPDPKVLAGALACVLHSHSIREIFHDLAHGLNGLVGGALDFPLSGARHSHA